MGLIIITFSALLKHCAGKLRLGGGGQRRNGIGTEGHLVMKFHFRIIRIEQRIGRFGFILEHNHFVKGIRLTVSVGDQNLIILCRLSCLISQRIDCDRIPCFRRDHLSVADIFLIGRGQGIHNRSILNIQKILIQRHCPGGSQHCSSRIFQQRWSAACGFFQ